MDGLAKIPGSPPPEDAPTADARRGSGAHMLETLSAASPPARKQSAGQVLMHADGLSGSLKTRTMSLGPGSANAYVKKTRALGQKQQSSPALRESYRAEPSSPKNLRLTRMASKLSP